MCSSTLRYEEEEELASSDGGWTMTTRINEVKQSPGGTRRVLRSETYRFKKDGINETNHQENRRIDVKRGARRRCMDKFDEIKTKAKTEKRTKRSASGGSAAAVAGNPAPMHQDQDHGCAIMAASGAAATPALPSMQQDLMTQRDWAILRALQQLQVPEIALESLRERLG